jgi:flagellar hook assembly protein FlgD
VVEIAEVLAMAFTFSVPPANVLVTFADGPGVYQVEAVDSQGAHLKTLMNQRILRTSDLWITWDGKNDQGQDVPVGRYFVLCFKEGRMLQKILLIRVP